MTIAAILDGKGRNVFTMPPSSLLGEVVKLLNEKRIGVVLLAEGDSLAGILSERDVVRAVSENGGGAMAEPASKYMTSKVSSCSEKDTVVSVMAQMTSGRFRHIPVIEDGKIAGLVSIGDVVKYRIAETEKEAEDMRAYIAAV